jgi:hypothetical protein
MFFFFGLPLGGLIDFYSPPFLSFNLRDSSVFKWILAVWISIFGVLRFL